MYGLAKRAYVRSVLWICERVSPGSTGWARVFYREEPLTGFVGRIAGWLEARRAQRYIKVHIKMASERPET